MSKLKLQLCNFLLSSYIVLAVANPLAHNHNPYHHMEILDTEGKYRVEWETDWELKQVHFHVSVETHGFVAFGLSKDKLGSKSDQFSDIVIGGVDPNGTEYFSDRYAIGNRIPIVDDKQDWILRSAWESQTHTFLNFSRHFDTEDLEDLSINDNTVYLIWAYGETDSIAEFPSSLRGSRPTYLLDPDLTPKLIQLHRGAHVGKELLGDDVKIWNVQLNFDIPTKRTTFWGHIRELSLPKKHHIIGYTLKVDNMTKANVHHLLMLRCRIPTDQPSPRSLYRQFVNQPGEECYSQERHLGQIPVKFCMDPIAAFAIGGRSIFFPEEMGISVGASGQPEYYLFQTHYDNPEGRSDLRSQVHIDVYYTDQLRLADGGILRVGHHLPGAPSILLPPSSADHKIHGHCTPACTKKMLPPEGIKIVGALLHAHNAGRGLTIQQSRNNRELPRILDDPNWQFDFQPFRLLRNVATVLPGDDIKIQCRYDTTDSVKSIVGGYGTDQEMCHIFALYYNYLPEYPGCGSELISPDYTARYLAGTGNVLWNQSHFEFLATEPPLLAGMTLSEISDSQYVNWSAEQRARLQKDHNELPQEEICRTMEEILADE